MVNSRWALSESDDFARLDNAQTLFTIYHSPFTKITVYENSELYILARVLVNARAGHPQKGFWHQ
jgi:hypothetical protein